MAAYQIPPPPAMNCKGDVCTNWKSFKQAWDFYCQATELTMKPEIVKVGALCSVMGPDCRNIMMHLATLSEEDRRDSAQILGKLGQHFTPQKNVLFERFRFNSASQTETETVDQYVMRLRQLSESCEFEALREGLIRDRIVMGTTDISTRDRLLKERPVPDLNKCIDFLRASEISRVHKSQLNIDIDNDASGSVHAALKYKPKSSQKSGKKSSKEKTSVLSKCKFCGNSHVRDREECPAFGKTCKKCGIDNHFATVCRASNYQNRARKVHQADVELSDSDSEDSIYACHRIGSVAKTKKSKFMTKMTFKTTYPADVTVQLDSGATCSAMSMGNLQDILQSGKVKLDPPNGRVKLYDGRVVTPLGQYTFDVKIGGGTLNSITFDILENAPWPIIDGNTCIKNGWLSMNVEKAVNAVEAENEPLSKSKILNDYKEVFTGLGCLPGEYHIEIDPSVKPVQHAPRRVPVPLRAKFKAKITEMEKKGVIARVTEPTDWISSAVTVQKNDKLRICIDPKDLNEAIKRPKYQMPTVDEVLPKLAQAKVFTVLDAKDGFFQVKLDDESSYLTTFWTPFGRYRYLRCPFGISSAPEEYQRRQKEVLEGLEGVDVIADDIICFGSGDSKQEAEKDHDKNLIALLNRAKEVNLKFNKEKIKFKLQEVRYMGHLLTENGVRADPAKIEAILDMPRPEDAKAVQRLLGCVNYLSRYLPKLAEVSAPLRRLTEKDAEWFWESQQEGAYQTILKLMASTPVLRYYDMTQEVTLQNDASESGLGAVLLQNGQPVTFASKALTKTEQGYAQIEKECLAIVFACERFDQYLHGRDLITVQTDHKPLVPIFKKSIHNAPKRLQRMLLRLQKYNLKIEYLPGPQMYIADMLSRAYLTGRNKDEIPACHIFQVEKEEALFSDIASVKQLQFINVSTGTHSQIQKTTAADPVLQTLATAILTGWPDVKENVPNSIRQYWNMRDELTVQDGVIYKGMKVVIPTVMRKQMIAKSHTSHLGIHACVRRAKDVLYWPGMTAEITELVRMCAVCSEFLDKQQKEPLMTHKIPTLPWSKVGQDLFTLNGRDYLVTVDYYSDYFEIVKLNDTTARSVIKATKDHFACHGIADMVTDNGPQYTSQEFQQFKSEWNFNHTTSSPYHSQSNGKAESAVKIAKKLVKKCKRDDTDLQMALLEWRNTPDINGLSPVQKLMSRRTKTTMPTAEALLKPLTAEGVDDNIKHRRQLTKRHYDQHTKPLPELDIGDSVKLQPLRPKEPWSNGSCLGKVGPRSYLIRTEDGKLCRRNRKFLRTTNSIPDTTQEGTETPMPTIQVNGSPKQADPGATSAENIEILPPTPKRSATPPKVPISSGQYITRSGRTVKPTVKPDV